MVYQHQNRPDHITCHGGKMAEDDTSTKVCSRCKKEKSFISYSKRKHGKFGLHAVCNPCRTEQCRLFRKADPERRKRISRSYRNRHREEREQYRRAWRKANKDQHLEATRNHRRKNPQKYAAATKRWIQKNPARYAESQRNWRRANQDKVSVHRQRRRSRLRQASGSHTAQDISEIRILQRHCCAICRRPLNGAGTVDHIIPLVKGGSNDRRNLQITHHSCNARKNAKDPIQFMQELGFLI